MKHDRVTQAFTELEEWTWRRIDGDEFTWYVPLIPNAADWVHVDDPERDGYEGATLTLTLEDDTEEQVRGPWHATAQELRDDTGLNLKDLAMTKVKVRVDEGHVIYDENQFVMGARGRGLRIAEQLANLHEEPVTVETMTTNAGRKWRRVTPNSNAK